MTPQRNPTTTPLGFRVAWGEETVTYIVRTPKFARKLEWTSEAPAAPGWYWVATNPLWENEPEIVHVKNRTYDNRLHVYGFDEVELLTSYCKEYPRFWLGPLPMPELPNG